MEGHTAGQRRGRRARPDIRLAEGEVLVLSPNSSMFESAFTEVRPRSVDELREWIGISPDVHATLDRSACCPPAELQAGIVRADDLETEDPQVRARARSLAYTALRHYVSTGDARMEVWTPVLDRYLDISKAVIHVAWLNDIEVANGARLVIAAATNAVYANEVRLYGTGTVTCSGPTTFRVRSFQGHMVHLGPVGAKVTAADLPAV